MSFYSGFKSESPNGADPLLPGQARVWPGQTGSQDCMLCLGKQVPPMNIHCYQKKGRRQAAIYPKVLSGEVPDIAAGHFPQLPTYTGPSSSRYPPIPSSLYSAHSGMLFLPTAACPHVHVTWTPSWSHASGFGLNGTS